PEPQTPGSPELERILNVDRVFKVGLEAEFKPFEYKTESGELVGFDVDLAREIGKELGVEVKFHETKWEGIIPGLLSKEYDIILSGLSYTEERAKTIAFSQPYYHTGLCLLVNRERNPDVKHVLELDQPGKTFVVKTGTTSDIWATENVKQAGITRVGEEATAALEVAQARADAMIYDQLSIKNHAEQYQASTYALLEPFTSEPYAIGIRLEDTGLKARIDEILEKMEADGRMDALYTKHFGDLPRVKA
ncbi:MAG TPA: transporter substrate-binding domain-containing protein, partial [bacterium]|nr:transporter substrate-binding domain-containing protein [bacterium]